MTSTTELPRIEVEHKDAATALRLLTAAVRVRGGGFRYIDHFGVSNCRYLLSESWLELEDPLSDPQMPKRLLDREPWHLDDEPESLHLQLETDATITDVCPACMVGLALYIGGEPLSRLAYYNSETAASISEMLGWDRDASRLFSAAQETQDMNGTWGKALDAALRWAEVIATQDMIVGTSEEIAMQAAITEARVVRDEFFGHTGE